VPAQRQEGTDELEHYKLQMRIMTDLINVGGVRGRGGGVGELFSSFKVGNSTGFCYK